MTTSTFVPADYEVSSGGSSFLKLEAGDTKIRILTDALIGKVGWKDQKPFRRAGADAVIDPSEVDMNDQGKPKINEFMAFYAYDYNTGKVVVVEFTQASIKKELVKYAQDADWGHPKNFDVTITKSGSGLLTKYSVKTSPPKAITKDIQEVVEAAEPTFDLAAILNIES